MYKAFLWFEIGMNKINNNWENLLFGMEFILNQYF